MTKTITKIPKVKDLTKPNVKQLEKIFEGDLDLVLFYLAWLKNGLNATKAYKELHPNVDEHSCSVLGCRQLAKVNKEAIMRAYGLDRELYFTQLKDGVQADKWNDFTGEREADHKTRKPYHDKLGNLLDLENPSIEGGLHFHQHIEEQRDKYQ